MKKDVQPAEAQALPRPAKKTYHAPILDELGELKNVTLGGSPSATFDSGDGAPGKRPV